MNQPTETDVFISTLQQAMETALTVFDDGIPTNPDVEILKKNKGWMKLSPLEAQVEPLHLPSVKAAITQREVNLCK